MTILDGSEIEYRGKEVDDFSGYSVQSSMTHHLSNVDKSTTVELDLNLGELMGKIDVLMELPFLIRKFIQTFITAPYVYQW